MRLILSVGSFGFAVLVCGAIGCSRDNASWSESNRNQAGETAHSPVQVTDLDGRSFDFASDVRGITVVLFARTDCPISNRYAPVVGRLYGEFHPRGVKFFLVYVDPRESADDIRRHVREYGYPCPALRDPGHELVRYCGATATPEAVVFDGKGAITYRGRIDDSYVDLGRPRATATSSELADAIEATVHGRPVAVPRTDPVGCRIADVKD
jgi:hypothetical protein